MRVIDLSYRISEGFALVSEHSDFHSGRSDGGLLATRIEVPGYLIAGGKTLNSFEPESFVRDAVLLDLTHMKPRQLIDDEDLEAAEEGAGLAIREGEIAILHTGWERFGSSEDYSSSHPALSESGAEYLEFKRVVGVGTDLPNVDYPENQALPVHSILMRGGIFVIESLCNLSEIDQPRFRLIALPPKIKAPVSTVRAVGALDGLC